MALFQYPMMTIIQEMCARIGLVTGSGLGGILKKKYSKKILIPLSGLVLIANTINIAADIGPPWVRAVDSWFLRYRFLLLQFFLYYLSLDWRSSSHTKNI